MAIPMKVVSLFLVIQILNSGAHGIDSSANYTLTGSVIENSDHFNDSDFSLRIVGGRLANRNEFPYQVALFYKTSETSFQFGCGGTIYNSKFIISASHCLQNLTQRQNYDPEFIRVATGQLQIPNYAGANGQFAQDLLNVRRIHVHPQFNGQINLLRSAPENDIGLLELENEIVFSESVMSINIENKNEVSEGMADVSGWGLTSILLPFQRPTINPGILPLKTARQTIYPRKVCGIRYTAFLPDYWLCVGTLGRWQSTCSGDSGGPLVCQRRGTQDRYLCGIVSTGIGCGLILTPELFTDVGKFNDYILSVAGTQ